MNQKKEELEYQYEILNSVINATPDLIFYKDYLNRDGTYIGCNDAFAKFVGKPIDKIIAHNDLELFGEEVGTFFRTKDREMLLENATKTNEELVTYPDGTEVLLSTSKTPFYDNLGKVIGLVGISRDITQTHLNTENIQEQKKALEAQKELYNVVFDTSFNGVLLMDIKTGLFTDCNNVIVKMLKLQTKEEVLNHHPSELSPEFQPDGRRSDEKSSEMIQIAAIKGTHTFEWKLKRDTEEEFWTEITLSKVKIANQDILHVSCRDIDYRKKAEEELTSSYNLLSTIINAVPPRIFWKDINLNYLGCNTAFANDAGKLSPESVVGKSDYDLSWKDQAELYRADDLEVIRTKSRKLFYEEPQTTADGKMVWLRTSKVPLYNDKNEVFGILGMYEDITEQKLAQIELKESQEHLKAIIENEPECVKLVNPRGQLTDMNPAGLKMLEADSLEEAQSHALGSYILQEWQAPFMALHKKVMNGESGKLEFQVKGLKGTKRWLETNAVPMLDSDGNVNMLLGITRDVTQRKESEQRIQYMANYDSLTGLPNRAKLDDQLAYILALANRNQLEFSLMFLDIDNFKDINDTLGHNIGDKLLVDLGKRIQSALREEDTIARLGGDEFILLIPNTDTDGAQLVAQKLLHTIKNPFSIEEHELTVTASIGISLYPTDGTNKETLFKNADAAMYRAKNEGRNNYAFFTKEMQTIAKRNLQLNNALHHALSHNELHLVYQPQISLKTGRIIGAEALLRWEHPRLGNISPAEFIPIAENSGLILSIGEWVLRTATKQLKSWIQDGMSPIVMSVNLSAVQFRHPNLSDLITQILESTGLAPECLELELTESVTMNNPEIAISIMNNLHERGIRMSIDDFGTGYSSLSYLKKFKVYKLKIDQSFVRDISTDPEDKAIVSAIIHMAESLGLTTIAEGVETIEQLDYLREQGCNEIQGYHYSKPLLAEGFEHLYESQE